MKLKTFPLLAQSKKHGYIILFNKETSGTCVLYQPNNEDIKLGTQCHNDLSSCWNNSIWEILPMGTKVELIQD